jgi:hypothetical protein
MSRPSPSLSDLSASILNPYGNMVPGPTNGLFLLLNKLIQAILNATWIGKSQLDLLGNGYNSNDLHTPPGGQVC